MMGFSLSIGYFIRPDSKGVKRHCSLGLWETSELDTIKRSPYGRIDMQPLTLPQ